ncbi:MAG: hypothetical protein QF718_01795 [Phycisphaerales bacterium]|jgi:hypothetical protein|nr:hypothetical protein [Phycisphaerales bacterium]
MARILFTLIVIQFSITFSIQEASALQPTPETNWTDSVVKTEGNGPGILIIPMNGQMHTDIRHNVYEDLVDRIKETKPDLILVEMLSRDWRNSFHNLMGWGDRQEFSAYDKTDLVKLAEVFHVSLGDLNQVIWVKDASGTSSVLALSWPTMYMSHDGYLHATMGVSRMFDYIEAEDTYGKIREAAVAHSKAFATYGNRSPALLRAFVDPEVSLSGTWKGKKVEWEESTDGDFVVDPGEELMPHLSASIANEVGISEGNVHTRNDVLLARGIREYHLVGEDITEDINSYIDAWRESFKKACEFWLDSQQYQGWAVGDEQAMYLRKQLTCLKKLLRLMQDSDPVKMRVGWKYRINERFVKQSIEEIEEILRSLREEGGSGGRSGGGGGPIGGGGG